MLVELGDPWAIWISAATATALSLLAGWWATGWPVSRVARDGPLTRLRPWERDGRWWSRHLAVRRWKDALPEAGALFGGYAKDRIRSRTTADLDRFRAETIRAERVHWLSAVTGVLHVVWCRPQVAAVLAVLGLVGNAPFIVIQRTNRGRLERLLRRRRARPSGTGGTGGTGAPWGDRPGLRSRQNAMPFDPAGVAPTTRSSQ